MESWVGTKKKYFVAATIKCAYPFPKSKKDFFSVQSVALAKTRYPIIVHGQAFRIITCQPPIEWEPSWSWSYGSWTMQSVSITTNVVSSNLA